VTDVIEHFLEQIRHRRLKFSTIATYIHTIASTGIVNVSHPRWRDFTKFIMYEKVKEEVAFPTPLTPSHAILLFETLKLEKETVLLALASVAWAFAARISDVQLVKAKNIYFQQNCTMKILFQEGKGVKMRGQAYTVQALNPFASAVEKVVRKLPPTATPFAAADLTKLRNTMRKIDPSYEMRSFRRGSLQQMAKLGTPLDVLRSISGHACNETLLRYLHWGLTAEVVLAQQTVATQLLW
jgi:hypothetical protein